MFYEIFSAALSRQHGYPLTTQPGPDVLRITATITELDLAATPGTAGTQHMHVVSPADLTLLMELRDSQSGALLVRAIDKEKGRTFGNLTVEDAVSNSAEARRALEMWAGLLRARARHARAARRRLREPIPDSTHSTTCRRNLKMKRAICFAVIGVLTTLACAAKEPFKREEAIEVSATVEAVDPESRLLVLNGPAGPSAIVAGPEVKNFAQIKVGDKVKVTYKAAFAAKITKSKDKPEDHRSMPRPTRRPLVRCRPLRSVRRSRRTVQIESVDTSFDTVSFKRPDGFVRTIAVESPGRKEIHPHAEEGRQGRRRVHRGAGHFGGPGG